MIDTTSTSTVAAFFNVNEMVAFSITGFGYAINELKFAFTLDVATVLAPQKVAFVFVKTPATLFPLICKTGIFLPAANHLYSTGLEGVPNEKRGDMIESILLIVETTLNTSNVPVGVLIEPHASTLFTRF